METIKIAFLRLPTATLIESKTKGKGNSVDNLLLENGCNLLLEDGKLILI